MLFLIASLLFASSLGAEWQVLYPNVMTIAIGVSAPDLENVYVSGGNDGTGAAILKSRDAGKTWDSLPHDPQMLYLDVSVAPRSTFGISSALGIFGLVSGSSFTSDGEEFISTPDTPLFSASQSCVATDPSHFYLTGFWQKNVFDDLHDGVISSSNGGKKMEYFDWGMGTQARYGAFPSNTTWFLTGGAWPASLKARFSNPLEPFHLSPRVKLLRDASGAQSFKISSDASAMGSADGYLGVIARTTDGGRSFQAVFNDTGRFYFNGISCVDEKTCWAVAEGPEGAWIFATNDGERWEQQYFEESAGLFDVEMIDKNEGWAVGAKIEGFGFNALFLRTRDGGRTWENSNTVRNAYPNSISVVDGSRAYATAFLLSGLSSILVYE